MSGQAPGNAVGPLNKRGYIIFLAVLFAIGAAATTGLVLARRQASPDDLAPNGGGGSSAAASPSKEYSEFAAKYLRNWPTDRMPEMVLLFSGQQHNYEAPCGCTEPQAGGLERRYNLFSKIRGFGLPTVAMDLGDIYSTDTIYSLQLQAALKFRLSMKALAVMQYDAVNIGPEEFKYPLLEVAGFLLNFKSPYDVLAANIANKVDVFPGLKNDSSIFADSRIVEPKGSKARVAVVGTLGQSAIGEIVKNNPSLNQELPNPDIRFANNAIVLPKVLTAMKAKSPDIRVLLYQGTKVEAEKLAQAIDDFDIILYRTDQSDPPSQSSQAPPLAGNPRPKAQLVTVGHKGRWIGVMGVFRNRDNTLDLRWDVVLLNPDFKTPAEHREEHPIVKLLEEYTKKLKDDDYLAKYVKGSTPILSINGKNIQPKFLGSEACKNCHAKEFKKWKDDTAHSGAYQTLSQSEKAFPPHNRQFDGECVVCHTVGFKYMSGFRDNASGFTDEKKSAHLFGVGCENCHGPGSAHAENPKNVQLLAAMSPWKENPKDHLTKRVIEVENLNDDDPKKKAVPANEKLVALRVFQTCSKCHDTDNDHDFSLTKWKKIAHGQAWAQQK